MTRIHFNVVVEEKETKEIGTFIYLDIWGYQYLEHSTASKLGISRLPIESKVTATTELDLGTYEILMSFTYSHIFTQNHKPKVPRVVSFGAACCFDLVHSDLGTA